MNSILITGCNRGLGLGLVKALVKLPKPPQHLFATCRNKDQAKDLLNLAAQNSNIHVMEIDLRDYYSHDNLVKQIDDITGGYGLNLLFNNAGISPKSTRINMTKAEDIMNTLETNTVVPIMLAKACLPLLKKASKSQESLDLCVQRAAIINMSSMLGSIEMNETGGLYAYRTSKAALNAATKSLSIDLLPHNILCVALHPGWVRTEMGGKNAPLEVDPTTAEIIDTIMKFKAKHNGGFYQYNGDKLPW
ncbi:C-signal isoform X1 [Stomoxys calcitrans]|uniref:C-signal isoform X1 n=1 Tax=Stomoxys calcitrans TaxID=35570 RepID=UPI0027E2E64E|nr:C-signal isoform X1 [Stomoxys calcitrans]XP_013097902.2 C-signal isoform X1 [Stomoxys calcitrans]XP_013097904.2 C-signal isoform X1 [Stomoxys calcitrans]XP_013097905.2 C-signal isoform X1 [Stomoxys calcitrans]XP_013097906.2 C-signal isoform X1 [Stomoxys calcitrans]